MLRGLVPSVIRESQVDVQQLTDLVDLYQFKMNYPLHNSFPPNVNVNVP